MKKLLILALLSTFVIACKQSKKKPEMYEKSAMSVHMRQMVDFSYQAKADLKDGKEIEVPEFLLNLKDKEATRDQQDDAEFQAYADVYLSHLKNINSGDSSQAYYLDKSIEACESCHMNFCGGPLVVIEELKSF